ncbi:MAG: hypothetical protein R3F11_16085 [Verrucomicrobiales bacterium]
MTSRPSPRLLLCALLAALASAFMVPAPAPAAEPMPLEMRNDLERVYGAWRRAVLAKDLRGWVQATSRYRQFDMRNQIVSRRDSYPSGLFSFQNAEAANLPEILALKAVRALKTETTAQIIYFGRVNVGAAPGGQIPENLLALRFFKEATGWKFDRLLTIGIGDEAREEIRGGNLQFLDEPEFDLIEQVPPVPKLVAAPEYVAQVIVVAPGYAVRVRINGAVHETVALGHPGSGPTQEIVQGGLRLGKNDIEIKTRKLDSAAGRSSGVRVLVLADRAPNSERIEMVKVFDFNPGEEVPAEHEGTIMANTRMLGKAELFRPGE